MNHLSCFDETLESSGVFQRVILGRSSVHDEEARYKAVRTWISDPSDTRKPY